eukprot:6283577-Pyramimonas_sp.AAC.1
MQIHAALSGAMAHVATRVSSARIRLDARAAAGGAHLASCGLMRARSRASPSARGLRTQCVCFVRSEPRVHE